MKVTVLIENTAAEGFVCEHGLSLLIEHNGRKILLDAGTTEAFADNAAALGVSLADVDYAVLSHGHYDHSGGFNALFRAAPESKVYARKEFAEKYYSGNGGMHEIGVPVDVLENGSRFIPVEGSCELEPGVYLVSHSTAGLDRIGARSKLYKEKDGQLVPDDFIHEQSLVIDTENGLVVFNSCSHGGAANIIAEAKAFCGRPIYGYAGGLHMKGTAEGREICTFSPSELDDLCSVFDSEAVAHVYTGHCTGLAGIAELKKRLGSRLHSLTSGLVFDIP